ncbi:alternate-type signal peptide domain-containing protein [Arthrobacter sp. ATA002]|uniref:alternate-type signal peptide domain-containing protein n=1 Tax=Arthrobacter sp. ATA002 TaxID=2991715 RepID=UPI0022A730A9|nr:alternate-type signal peptide domain-containing protein [Arthrobacter sp. ATA002]WAP51142.1 alternate-type signal peptide domain-containing protein [Arthrobacter sp. ATA002]
MNKMAKGALATGVGVALLLGGGGTLAVWNDTAASASGSIVAGDLQLNPVAGNEGKGIWTNAANTVVDLTKYKVVPGDVLTYTQKLDVVLSGDLMAAKLTMTPPAFSKGGFTEADVDVVLPAITNGKGAVLSSDTILTKDDSGVVTASAKFIFKDTGVGQKQSSTNAAATFEAVTFKLDQQAVK